jgi:thiol:disulfide interchange protein
MHDAVPAFPESPRSRGRKAGVASRGPAPSRNGRGLALALAFAGAMLPVPAALAAEPLAAPAAPPAAGMAADARPADSAAVLRYDAARDAAADIDRALAAAAASGRRVLLIVGGDWCKDCRDLDALLVREPDVARARDARFVPVKVYVGSDNRNETVLARYPKLAWVPTLIELDPAGQAARATPSTEFHSTDRLDPVRVRAFFAGS